MRISDWSSDVCSSDLTPRYALSTMPRMALGLAYDGSSWQGWQTQPGGLTVQDTLESALAEFLNHPVGTICAGRTDTGVHALEQIVHLDTQAARRPESWEIGRAHV